MMGSRAARFATLIAVCLGWAAPRSAPAQVREPGEAVSAGEHAGPLADISRPLSEGSAAVHDGAATVGESSGGPMADGATSVHTANDRTVLSGPVSSISRGPVDAVPASIGLAVEEASTGAVKHDAASPLGEQISQPLRELGALRVQMRKQREDAQRLALQQSIAPVVSEPAPAADGEPNVGAAVPPDAAPAPAAAPDPDAAPAVQADPAPRAPEERADAEFAPPSDGLDPEGDLHGEDAPAPDDPDPSN